MKYKDISRKRNRYTAVHTDTLHLEGIPISFANGPNADFS